MSIGEDDSVAIVGASGSGKTTLLGLLAGLDLLTRGEILLAGQWRECLPAGTSNYFLINIQPEQAGPVLATLRGLGVADPTAEPLSTGKPVAINGKPPQRHTQGPDNDGATDRPINFSWRHQFPPSNRLLSGRFWSASSTAAEASVEEAWARRDDLRLGDRIPLLLGEPQRSFTVTSVRTADWDSFRANFFLLLNAGAVQDAPYNPICAFHLPRTSAIKPSLLSRTYPNVSLLDINAILQRMREVIDRVAQAVQLSGVSA